ncbi:hypothetical protein ASF16_14950 [Acidovorax sp. Leaf78]|nr:hypothetical protein ASF16_14950 [Acidovorax sp. Leaf78]
MSIFTRLREERERLGLTQEAFGSAGGVLKGAVINYEKGARFPDVSFLAGVANVGADVQYIVTGRRADLSSATLAPAERALLDGFAQADDAGRATLSGVAELARRAASIASPVNSAPQLHIGGDVGQQVIGDQTNNAPVTFTMGGKRK